MSQKQLWKLGQDQWMHQKKGLEQEDAVSTPREGVTDEKAEEKAEKDHMK